MKKEGLQRALTGAGIGVLVTFLISLHTIPETTPVKEVFVIYTSGLIVGALAFWFLNWEFRASPAAYVGGLLAIFAITAVSKVSDVTMTKVFIVILLSVAMLGVSPPTGVLDTLLSGPAYFGGALTALAVEGVLDMLKSLDTMVGTVFVGVTGTIAAFFTTAILLLISTRSRKPKP
ncbi:hypothetical protein A3L09_08185 [Thermococcus profundus]|uniref:Uncharacterized protein n=1 Tax=Thermococcus profundus TaxID=49899 RepID=A0A2Z2MCH9_THEPR|nr:hypothetical protein [Thermococcus profundus]ASJ03233.1 hypothetical protein A3L09_08185 [Thermococcus profundus]